MTTKALHKINALHNNAAACTKLENTPDPDQSTLSWPVIIHNDQNTLGLDFDLQDSGQSAFGISLNRYADLLSDTFKNTVDFVDSGNGNIDAGRTDDSATIHAT